jgi:hypothetical protein
MPGAQGDHVTKIQYQGFEDFVTDPGVVGGPPRALSGTIASDTATDIALRSAPITTRGEREILRIAASGARLTIATDTFTLPKTEQIVQRLGGVVIERISLPDTSAADGLGYRLRTAGRQTLRRLGWGCRPTSCWLLRH